VKRVLKRLVVAFAVLIGLLAVAEGVTRLFVPPPILYGDLVADPLVGFRMKPGKDLMNRDTDGEFPYRLNAHGFRGPELPADERPPGTKEILLLGDSFLNAWAVREEKWIGTQVREALARAGTTAETHALCSDDYGTAQQLILLREYGARIRPDVVVVLLFPGNDLINNTIELAGWSTVSPGDYFRPYLVPDGDGFDVRHALPVRALLRRSRIFSAAEMRWLKRGRDTRSPPEALPGVVPPTKEERLAAGDLPLEYLELFRKGEPLPRWEAAWRTTERLIEEVREETEDLGARLLVVVIPHLYQVEDGACVAQLDGEMQLRGAGSLRERVDWNLPESRLEEFFHRAGIAHVQLLTPLRHAVVPGRPSVYVADGHLSGTGHTIAAEHVARFVLDGASGGLCFVPSEPADVRELYAASDWIDVSDAGDRELFAWGFNPWFKGDGSGAWRLDGSGVLLIPIRSAGLAVEGYVPDASRLPLEVRLNIPSWNWSQLQSITSTPFELRFAPKALPPHLVQDDPIRWVPAVLQVSPQVEDEEPLQVFLTGFGPADSSHAQASHAEEPPADDGAR
jgi:hypothetical protein